MACEGLGKSLDRDRQDKPVQGLTGQSVCTGAAVNCCWRLQSQYPVTRKEEEEDKKTFSFKFDSFEPICVWSCHRFCLLLPSGRAVAQRWDRNSVPDMAVEDLGRLVPVPR